MDLRNWKLPSGKGIRLTKTEEESPLFFCSTYGFTSCGRSPLAVMREMRRFTKARFTQLERIPPPPSLPHDWDRGYVVGSLD